MAIRIIGKLDFQTGIHFPKRVPSLEEYSKICGLVHNQRPFQNGTLKEVQMYVDNQFETLGISTKHFSQKNSFLEAYPSQVY